jgi:hypothetical protein
MKKIIRLTEGDLHRIVKKSVNRILKESNYFENDVVPAGKAEQLGYEYIGKDETGAEVWVKNVNGYPSKSDLFWQAQTLGIRNFFKVDLHNDGRSTDLYIKVDPNDNSNGFFSEE